MLKVELLYFVGCPHIERARTAIFAAGVSDFVEIDQGTLPEVHCYRDYSSPTILVNGKAVAGSKSKAAACSLINWDEVSNKIAAIG